MPSWEKILEQFALVKAAPVPFFAVTLAIIGIVWYVENWAYSSIIANRDSTITNVTTSKDEIIVSLRERIQLRDEQLQNKFKATPPDEAKSIIQTLQDKLDKLSPRRLPSEKKAALEKMLKLPSGTTFSIEIVHDGNCSDCNQLAADFSTLFSSAGWRVTSGMVIGLGFPIPSGVAVVVSDPNNLTESQRLVISALQSENIPMDIHRDIHQGSFPREGVNLDLIFTVKSD